MSTSKLSDTKKLFGFWAISCLLEIRLITLFVDLNIWKRDYRRWVRFGDFRWWNGTEFIFVSRHQILAQVANRFTAVFWAFNFQMSISLLCSIEMKAECLIVFLRYSISCLQERSHQLITLQIQGYFIHLNLEGSIRRTKNGWFLVILSHNLWLIKYDSNKMENTSHPNNLGGVHVVSFKC